MRITSNIVVFGRVWRGEPTSNILLQLVAYRTHSVPTAPLVRVLVKTHVSSYSSHLSYFVLLLGAAVSLTATDPELNLPRTCRISSMDDLPSTRKSIQLAIERKQKSLHTIHDEFHVAHKAMNNLKCLGPSHASLIDGESVKSMEHILDLALAQQFLCKLL